MTDFVLGGGCFWCIEAVFRRLKGVKSVENGYAGGKMPSPTYEDVTTGATGHAEVVRVSFDESVIPASTLLDIFFLIHDPTSLNRQGNDVGPQYRSIMLYGDDQQKTVFEEAAQRAAHHWGGKIVTEIVPLDTFYQAEDYHQDYFNKNPDAGYCQVIIAPKITKARAVYSKWFKHET